MKNLTFGKIRRYIRLNKEFATRAAILVVCIIGFFVGLLPALQKTIVMVKDLYTLRDEIQRIQKKVTFLSSLDQATLEQTSQNLLAAVPADKSVASLLSTVEALATKNNLVISEFTIEGLGSIATSSARKPMKAEGYSVSNDVSFSGDLVDIRNFLSECVKVRRLMRVKGIQLSATKTDRMSANLIIEFFYLPLPSTIGKPSDPLDPLSSKEEASLEKLLSYPVVFGVQSLSTLGGGTNQVVQEPTTPTVIDPFAGPKRQATSTPTHTPLPTPVATLTVSPTVNPTLSPTATPTPTP